MSSLMISPVSLKWVTVTEYSVEIETKMMSIRVPGKCKVVKWYAEKVV